MASWRRPIALPHNNQPLPERDPLLNFLRQIRLLDSYQLPVRFLDRTPGGGHRFLVEPQHLKPAHLPPLFNALVKACSDATSPETILRLLTELVNSRLLTTFLGNFIVKDFVCADLVDEKKEEFLFDVLSIIIIAFEKAESLAYEKLFFLVSGLETTLSKVTPSLQSVRVQGALDYLISLRSQIQTSKTKASKQIEESRRSEPKPPNDFRTINVVPSANELRYLGPSFLRANVVKGSYQSVNDYLDVQFRLLREDLVGPLRNGIGQYLANQGIPFKDRPRIRDVRIYPKCRIANRIFTDNGVAYDIFLDQNTTKRINWKSSRRLMFGSLVCFSSDNFETIYFATVVQQDNLQAGEFSVCFDEQPPPAGREYTVVESVAFFEAYKHILLHMQHVDPKKFPMTNYLVDCKIDVKPPAYQIKHKNFVFDLSSVAKKSSQNRITEEAYEEVLPAVLEASISEDLVEFQNDVQTVTEYDHSFTWKISHQDLDLDQSQSKAFCSALRSELAIIQGPPGTGKTYIGLKIVKCLLDTIQINFEDTFGPILLVCYTNHALDQFLDGILNFTEAIIRVGNRSQSKRLQRYTINNLRRGRREFRETPDMEDVQCSLTRLESLLQNNLFGFCQMKPFIAKSLGKIFDLTPTVNEYDVFIVWLLGEHLPGRDFIVYDLAVNDVYETMLDEIIQEGKEDMEDGVKVMDDENDMDQWEMYQRQVDGDNDDIAKGRKIWKNVLSDQHYSVRQWNNILKDEFLGSFVKRNFRGTKLPSDDDERELDDLWGIPLETRWAFYRLWLKRFKLNIKSELFKLEKDYNVLRKQQNETNFLVDMDIMKSKKVVAMTTSGASRYGRVLQILQPKVVIVEEAAEVLEGHIISSLSPGCEHLILIGDHKQLKPSNAVYDLAKKYHLDISLFERFVRNDFPLTTLKVQHRMRPEIASLMQFIYNGLLNDKSVEHYKNVRGVSDNLLFIDHSEPEAADMDTSYKNQFEAEYAVRLCEHFLLNEYLSSQITILTLYSGQLFLLRSLMHHEKFTGVRTCIVDNFQGEENDIIILSLVRSNDEERIGFAGIDNRVCVALSRAKKGLYVLGNFSLLATKSEMWSKIVNHLRRKQQVCKGVSLKCKLHPQDQTNLIKCPADFCRAPEGGCGKRCGMVFSCGHSCPRYCHRDLSHDFYQCKEKCTRLCRNGHSCRKLCCDDCKCEEIIPHEFIPCHHQTTIKCFLSLTAKCKENCGRLLGCGHVCPATCGERCPPCMQIVSKTIPKCGHDVQAPCYKDPTDLICQQVCEKVLSCDHACPNLCGQECPLDKLATRFFLHIGRHQPYYRCPKPCEEKLSCEHPCPEACGVKCPPCPIIVPKCIPKCGHQVEMQCGIDPSNYRCPKPCEKSLLCGHRCTKSCGDPCPTDKIDLFSMWHPYRCKEPCVKTLPCDHLCPVTCGEPCPLICNEMVTKKIPTCGHDVMIKCHESRDKIKCQKPCEKSLCCGHKCKAICGDVCPPCNERVQKSVPLCGHNITIKCTASRSINTLCDSKCDKLLRCGHRCNGICRNCLNGRIHVPCVEKVRSVLVCGHEINTRCSWMVQQPCDQRCNTDCVHARCQLKCGDECTPCKKTCAFGCQHKKCSKLCHEICDQNPCENVCSKKRHCKRCNSVQSCIGLCGEYCPKECIKCDRTVLQEIAGTDDVDKCRFITLLPCCHTFEVSALEQFILQYRNGFKLVRPFCPRCKFPLTQKNSWRCMYLVKEYEMALKTIKRIFNKELYLINAQKQVVPIKLQDWENEFKVPEIQMFFKMPQRWTRYDPVVIETLMQILRSFVQLDNKFQTIDFACDDCDLFGENMRVFLRAIKARNCLFSEAELLDCQNEIQRLHFMLAFLEGEREMDIEDSTWHNCVKYVDNCVEFSAEAEEHCRELYATALSNGKAFPVDLEVTQMERVAIIRKPTFLQMHWRKCPEGHALLHRDDKEEKSVICPDCSEIAALKMQEVCSRRSEPAAPKLHKVCASESESATSKLHEVCSRRSEPATSKPHQVCGAATIDEWDKVVKIEVVEAPYVVRTQPLQEGSKSQGSNAKKKWRGQVDTVSFDGHRGAYSNVEYRGRGQPRSSLRCDWTPFPTNQRGRQRRRGQQDSSGRVPFETYRNDYSMPYEWSQTTRYGDVFKRVSPPSMGSVRAREFNSGPSVGRGRGRGQGWGRGRGRGRGGFC